MHRVSALEIQETLDVVVLTKVEVADRQIAYSNRLGSVQTL